MLVVVALAPTAAEARGYGRGGGVVAVRPDVQHQFARVESVWRQHHDVRADHGTESHDAAAEVHDENAAAVSEAVPADDEESEEQPPDELGEQERHRHAPTVASKKKKEEQDDLDEHHLVLSSTSKPVAKGTNSKTKTGNKPEKDN